MWVEQFIRVAVATTIVDAPAGCGGGTAVSVVGEGGGGGWGCVAADVADFILELDEVQSVGAEDVGPYDVADFWGEGVEEGGGGLGVYCVGGLGLLW